MPQPVRIASVNVNGIRAAYRKGMGEWLASFEDDRVVAKERTRAPTTATPLELFFAPIKKKRTSLLIEKAVELGATSLRPVGISVPFWWGPHRLDAIDAPPSGCSTSWLSPATPLTRLTTQVKTQRTERASIQALPAPGFTTAAVAAAEQSERLDVPLLEAIVATDAVKTDLPLYVCAARADGKAPHLLDVVTGPCAVLVGPEGGLTDDDLAAISAAKPDAVAVTLGPSVLRAETAACVALAFAGAASRSS